MLPITGDERCTFASEARWRIMGSTRDAWTTHCAVKMSKLLKHGLKRHHGDVDVLAYHPNSGRLAMIGCIATSTEWI